MTQAQVLTRIVDGPIDQASLLAVVGHPDAGAHGWFVGVTRRTTGTRVTSLLSYEAARPDGGARVAEACASTAVERFGLLSLVIVHRLGRGSHRRGKCRRRLQQRTSQGDLRGAALGHGYFEADRSRFGSEERYADGTTEWVHPTAPHQSGPITELTRAIRCEDQG